MRAERSVGAFRERWVSWTRVSESGLPSIRVLLAFPALLLIIGAVLISLGLNGTSSAALYDDLYEGKDPDLIAGEPLPTRSDEWNVAVVWTIAQVEQGLPERNGTFPGGMDADLPFDLPHRGASIALKPHLWGFLFLDLDQAMAWKWWLPALALIGSAYILFVSLLPRRPALSAALAVAFYYSPFFQWWHQTSTFWPIVWACLAMATIVWITKSPRVWAGWVWSVPVAYATAVMAVGIYVPYIVPVVWVVVFYALGALVDFLVRGGRVGSLLARISPLLVAGALGAAATLIWLSAKTEAVEGLLGTEYPGERLSPTGEGGSLVAGRMLGSSFASALQAGKGFLGINASEASMFVLLGAFLTPGRALAHLAGTQNAISDSLDHRGHARDSDSACRFRLGPRLGPGRACHAPRPIDSDTRGNRDRPCVLGAAHPGHPGARLCR